MSARLFRPNLLPLRTLSACLCPVCPVRAYLRSFFRKHTVINESMCSVGADGKMNGGAGDDAFMETMSRHHAIHTVFQFNITTWLYEIVYGSCGHDISQQSQSLIFHFFCSPMSSPSWR